MKMRGLILVFGLAALVLLVMPQAMAKYTGQHNFLSGGDVCCVACHIQEATEDNSAHPGLSCRDCHSDPSFEDPFSGLGLNFHAAVAVRCDNKLCHGIAGSNITAKFLNPREVHLPFFQAAVEDSLLQGGNEACLGCHTPRRGAAEVTVVVSPGYRLFVNTSGSEGVRNFTWGNI